MTGLLQLWLAAGETPHTFGSLWLEAPLALLHWDEQSLAAHLNALQQQLPPCSTPITRLLTSSSSLAGYLLSLDDAQQLQGHVHSTHGYMLFAPDVTDIAVVQESTGYGNSTGGGSSSADQVLSVYGTVCPGSSKQHIQPQAQLQGHGDDTTVAVGDSSCSTISMEVPYEWAGVSGTSGSVQQAAKTPESILLLRLPARPANSKVLMPVLILAPRVT